MLTEAQKERLRDPSGLLILDGFAPDSPSIHGPYPCVGGCVSKEEKDAAAWVDALPVRHGDIGLWYMPSLPVGEQYAAKWFVGDGAGRGWLACKYFAVRYRSDFHLAIGRVVAILSGAPGSLDPALSSRMTREIQALRMAVPVRDDLIVFSEDMPAVSDVVAEINRRHSLS